MLYAVVRRSVRICETLAVVLPVVGENPAAHVEK